MPGHDPDLQGYYYHPEKPSLLAEAGIRIGAGFPVVQLWSVHQAETTKAELAAYQRYLTELGVQVEIHFAPDWPAYKAMLQQGKLPMFRLVRFADIPDPDNFLAPMSTPRARPITRSTKSSSGALAGAGQGGKSMMRSESRSTARWSASSWTMSHGLPRIIMSLNTCISPTCRGWRSAFGPPGNPAQKIWFKKNLIEGG